MRMTANFSSFCKKCGMMIHAGDPIQFYRGSGSKHEGCAEWTLKAAAKRLKIHPNDLYALAVNGHIPFDHSTGTMLFNREDVERFAQKLLQTAGAA